MSALDWPLDADGYPHREAARVLLFDDTGRVLLAMGHDEDQPDRAWWFTIGGGIEEGEDPRAAAVREVFEETGLRLDAHELVGPVPVSDRRVRLPGGHRAPGRVVLYRPRPVN